MATAKIIKKKTENDDWAYLSKFKNENAQIMAQPYQDNRIIFFGDSITAGWETHNSELFGNQKCINRGINGQTTSQMLLRFRFDVIELKPEKVIILAGTNDIAGNTGTITLENILGNLISMCELANENNIKVVLCSLLPAKNYPWQKEIKPAEKIKLLNTMILEYAKRNNIVYIDYYAAMVDGQKGLQSIYSDDGVHPNKEGYRIMKLILQSAIL